MHGEPSLVGYVHGAVVYAATVCQGRGGVTFCFVAGLLLPFCNIALLLFAFGEMEEEISICHAGWLQ
jgi:hypothetical protein